MITILSFEFGKGLAPDPKTFTNLVGGKALTFARMRESPVKLVL